MIKKKKVFEVELRASLNSEQHILLLKKMKMEGASLLRSIDIFDEYWCPLATKSFADIEMNKIGSYSLRLRKLNYGGKECICLNTKVIASENDHNAWEEHEISVDSFNEGREILRAIGLKPFFVLEKIRTDYKVYDAIFSLEDIRDFGKAVEAEIIATSDKVPSAKKRLRGLFEKFGISESQIFPKSITNILMHKRASF